jgi:hypothetical protein
MKWQAGLAGALASVLMTTGCGRSSSCCAGVNRARSIPPVSSLEAALVSPLCNLVGSRQSLFPQTGSCRARRTAGSRKMLEEDIGSEQRPSAKSHDFHRE